MQEPSSPLPRRHKGQRELVRSAEAKVSHDDANEGHPRINANGHGRDNGKKQGEREDDVNERGRERAEEARQAANRQILYFQKYRSVPCAFPMGRTVKT